MCDLQTLPRVLPVMTKGIEVPVAIEVELQFDDRDALQKGGFNDVSGRDVEEDLCYYHFILVINGGAFQNLNFETCGSSNWNGPSANGPS